MSSRRFILLEPSKVGTQHITLLQGYLQALAGSDAINRSFEIEFHSSIKTLESLPVELRSKIKHRRVPVMNGESRRLIRKSVLEFLVVFSRMLFLRREDILIVTCVLPPTLIGIEWLNFLLRRTGIVVLLHGEVEGLWNAAVQRIGSYGFWVTKWIDWRRRDSRISLLVTDDFIKNTLASAYPKIDRSRVFVAYNPVTTYEPRSTDVGFCSAPPRVAFIGYRTPLKGFGLFLEISRQTPGLCFVEIGGGRIVDVSTGDSRQLTDSAGYMDAIATCSVAFFPYVGGYTCSLSAALLDALSAGVHVVATRLPCFVSMAECLGPDFVTLVDSPDDAKRVFRDVEWVRKRRVKRNQRLQALARSKYGISGVRACFEAIATALPDNCVGG